MNTTKAQHTVGLWKVVNHPKVNSSQIIIRIETETDSICEVHNLYRPESSLDGLVEKQANAKLIASAPELLETCKILFDELMKSKSMIEPARIPGAFGAINKATELFKKLEANV